MGIPELIKNVKAGDKRSLARCISIVENEIQGYDEILSSLEFNSAIPVIGITGPPGAGKSSLLNGLISEVLKRGKKAGVIAVDPTSPFNFGSVLGDRVRMSEHFTNENVFIRSMATRGALGGLSPKVFEVVDLMKAAKFDFIFVETVGVGQSEVEIAGLADTTILVLVPEAGDEIQTIKSGVMEIADIFVVNKADRDGAATFLKNLKSLVHSRPFSDWTPPVLKTVASKGEGLAEVISEAENHNRLKHDRTRMIHLMTEKAWMMIQNIRMKGLTKKRIFEDLEKDFRDQGFNLYNYLKKWI